MPISIYDSVSGQVPKDYFIETEGPLASDDTYKCTPIQLGAMFFETQSADYEIKAGEIVLMDVETGGVNTTVDLPASPLVNQRFGLILSVKTTPALVTYLNPNGKTINGTSGNLELDTLNDGVIVQYDGTEWKIVVDLRSSSSGPSQAVQADIEDETNEDTYVPPDLLKFSPGAAKAGGNVDMTSTAVLASNWGVDSVSDAGTGTLGVTLANAMDSTTYVLNSISGQRETQAIITSTTQFVIYTRSSSGTLSDAADICFTVYGTLA